MLNILNPISINKTALYFSGQPTQLPPVESYSEPVPGGSKFLELRKVNNSIWTFAHRGNAPIGAVHTLTVVKDSKGVANVLFIMEKRPPLGSENAPITIQLPAGLVGDKAELDISDITSAVKKTASSEVFEEAGLTVKKVKLLNDEMFMTSPGLTTERKGFALVMAEGNPNTEHLEEEEKNVQVGYLTMPVTDFLDDTKFAKWLAKQKNQGRIVCMDVLAMRGLPSLKKMLGTQLNITA